MYQNTLKEWWLQINLMKISQAWTLQYKNLVHYVDYY